jgi:hypothetical protein
MRTTTGLLLTAALLLPGTAQAQFGGPGLPYDQVGRLGQLSGSQQAQFGGPGLPYDPLQDGLRPRFVGIPGLPSAPGSRYVAPSRFQPWGGGIPDQPVIPGMPNIPGVPDGFGQIGPAGFPGLPRSPYDRFGLDPSLPGIPGLPGRLGTPNVSGVPSIGDPFGRRFGVQLPPGADGPYDPTARFRGPAGVSPGFPAVPDIRNLPQITPVPAPNFDFKPDLHLTPALSSSRAVPPLSGEVLGWAAGFLGFVFLVALVGGFLKGRRRT